MKKFLVILFLFLSINTYASKIIYNNDVIRIESLRIKIFTFQVDNYQYICVIDNTGICVTPIVKNLKNKGKRTNMCLDWISN